MYYDHDMFAFILLSSKKSLYLFIMILKNVNIDYNIIFSQSHFIRVTYSFYFRVNNIYFKSYGYMIVDYIQNKSNRFWHELNLANDIY